MSSSPKESNAVTDEEIKRAESQLIKDYEIWSREWKVPPPRFPYSDVLKIGYKRTGKEPYSKVGYGSYGQLYQLTMDFSVLDDNALGIYHTSSMRRFCYLVMAWSQQCAVEELCLVLRDQIIKADVYILDDYNKNHLAASCQWHHSLMDLMPIMDKWERGLRELHGEIEHHKQ
ncbi:MAG: hypothetical protein Q9208_005323 [Pyrenodesmia sp. 3 TL-2023]